MLIHADEREPLDSKLDSGRTSNMEKKERRRTMAKTFLEIIFKDIFSCREVNCTCLKNLHCQFLSNTSDVSKKNRAKLDLLEEKCIDDNWSVEKDNVGKLERFYKIHLPQEMSTSNSRVHTDVDTP